jgi:hypothetical protein
MVIEGKTIHFYNNCIFAFCFSVLAQLSEQLMLQKLIKEKHGA